MPPASPPRSVPTKPAHSADDILDAFDAAWQTGPAPRLESFLSRAGGTARPKLLEELIKIDLEYRWRVSVPGGDPGGSNPRLEDYLRRFPELGSAERLPVALVAEEYRVRHWWGDRPERPEYARRFPRHGTALAEALRRVDLLLEEESVRRRKGTLPVIGLSDETLTTPTRPIQAVSVSSMVETVARQQLLTAPQLAELSGALQRRFPEPMALARELLERNWLTAYQVNHLLQGREDDLLLGPYVLLERLGEGGTGWVFKARHQHLQRLVAVKLLRHELLADPEVLARFYQEIQIVSQLSHPNVVHAYDAGPIGGNHVLVMEYAEGEDLGRLVRRGGPLPVEQACDHVRQAALGLQHIHERGQIHRDVKPSNLLLAQSHGPSPVGVVKVLDLGLAKLGKVVDDGRARMKLAGGSSARLTPDGAVVVGTPDYLAPEQASDFKQADHRADIYSLGCTLFYLLTGRPPFPGGTLGQKLVRHQFDEPPDVRDLRPEVPEQVAAVLRRMLAKDPARRYPSMAQVVVALSMEATARVPELPEARAARRPLPWRWFAVGGLAAALLLLVLGVLYWTGTSERETASKGRPGETEHVSAPQSIPLLFSTGVGPDGALLPEGAVDAHWTLTVPGGGLAHNVFVSSNKPPVGGPWLANTGACRWLSPLPDPNTAVPAGSYVWKMMFDLTGFEPATARLTALVAADNAVSDVRLNGQSMRLSARGFESATKLALAGRFVAGVNTLEFVVENDTPSPMGLRVELGGIAKPLAAEEGASPRFANAGFETPNLGTAPKSYAYAASAGWTFGGAPGNGSGITANNNDFTRGNPPAPEGLQAAFLQGTGSFGQTVSFPTGTYTISFKVAQRVHFNSNGQDFQVLVDGKVVGTFFPDSTSFKDYSTQRFTVAAGWHTVQFRGLNTRGKDNSVFIDGAKIDAAK